MFTLRRITSYGVELNTVLGSSYTLITAERNPKEFEEAKIKFQLGDEVYGFVSDENGRMQQLSIKQTSYIMTGEGATYSNVSP